ncbi:MAG TPA: lipoyl synthase [Methanomassiliicoccales archaeon]|nr:lipoyl synthase [Methanomassiliicoccales archaeon]HNX47644.1 lipoyl synthase [Methanomassiliicoccales archaeon]HPR97927.1 lipoyl synthase [Methanomassiliicoccales archaeon]
MAPPDVSEKPPWLRTKVVMASGMGVRGALDSCGLRTVCDSSRCPNLGECWGKGHATFIILGERCTRSCQFCAVPSGTPSETDPDEVGNLAEAVRRLRLRHVVVTSVTRDDLPDGGASIFAEVVREVRWNNPGTTVELLIPDLQGNREALETILEVAPDVLGHNIETVRSMQWIRDRRASYERSLGVLKMTKDISPGTLTKSSLMLGLGETREELVQAMKDLRSVGVDLLTLGQYLPPKGSNLQVRRYVPPQEFEELHDLAMGMGFKGARAGPLVRSSYDAFDLMIEAGARRC